MGACLDALIQSTLERCVTKRAGFKAITVDGAVFQYAVSLASQKLFLYGSDGKRHEIPLPKNDSKSWRGKHGDGSWGKREVAALMSKGL